MLIYIIDEGKVLDADSMKNNKKLDELINLRIEYKIPLYFLLTHFDDYCDKIKKDEKLEKNWKENCKNTYENNKINLINYIKDKGLEINEKDIMHVVLGGSKELTEEEKIKNLPEDIKEDYDKGNEIIKKIILKSYYKGKDDGKREVQDFLGKEIKILRQKDLIEEMRKILPSQYCNALNQINE